MGASERLQVRVNDELVLDAGACEDVTSAHGPERLIRPPMTTLFNQVLAYLREKPDPPNRPPGSMVGREGIAAAAVTLRWGSYLSVLLDHDKLRAIEFYFSRHEPGCEVLDFPWAHLVDIRE
jgi:hypothetical protein